MNIEEQLKEIILERYKSVRAFTQAFNIPYSTLDSVFKRGIYNSGIGTIIKIFDALDLDIESIKENFLKKREQAIPQQQGRRTHTNLSFTEIVGIKKYRALDEHGKKMVDFVLNEETARVEKENPSASFPATTSPPPEEIDIEAEVEEYRHMLELQAKAKAKSSALRDIK